MDKRRRSSKVLRRLRWCQEALILPDQKHPLEVYAIARVKGISMIRGYRLGEAQGGGPKGSKMYRVMADDAIVEAQIILDSDVVSLSNLESLFDNLRPHLPLDISAEWLMQVHLAVHELVMNIIMHAYNSSSGEIRIVAMLEWRQLNIDVYDNGCAFESPEVTESLVDTQEIPESGYGLQILTTVMDTVEYTRSKNAFNHWRLMRRV